MAAQPTSKCEDVESEQLLDRRPQASSFPRLSRRRRLLASAVGLAGAIGLAWIVDLGGDRARGWMRPPPQLLALAGHPPEILRSEANYTKAIQLFGSANASSSAFLEGPYEVARARAAGILPEDDYPNTTDEAKLMAYWVKEAKRVRQIEAKHRKLWSQEKMYRLNNQTNTYLHVSNCAVNTGLLLMKFSSSVLNLVALLHICPKIQSLTPKQIQEHKRASEELNNLARRDNGRRLSSGVAVAAGQIITSKEQAVMGCAANIQGLISGLTACIQYASGIVEACPSYLPQTELRTATCTDAVAVTISGITKSSSAASDIKYQCRDPLNTSYTAAINPRQKATVTASCVVNVGQATAYMAKVGLSVDALVKHCQRPDMFEDRFAEAACVQAVGAQFNQIGQVATYLSAAANGCGPVILVPYGCANRAAAIITGMGDVVEGAGKLIGFCVPRPETTTTPSRQRWQWKRQEQGKHGGDA